MLRCSKEAFAACPDSHLCGSREDATYTEGSDCDKFNQEISKHPEQYGRWIPVTERTPRPGERVIARIPGCQFVGEMYITDQGNWRRYDGNPADVYWNRKVSHWMPLPEPPKE